MPIYEVTDPLGRIMEVQGSTPPSPMQIQALFERYDSEKEERFAEERTFGGQAFETVKAVPRNFAGSFLTAGEGLAELADAATNFVGLEDLIDSGEENELVRLSREGRASLQEAMGADEAYRDTWLTKFGEGVGSFASFFTPAAALKVAGATGKLAGLAQTAGTGALAVGMGSGEQAQRIQAARKQGMEISEEDEDLAIFGGSVVGLSELLPVNRLLRRISADLDPATKISIKERITGALATGGAEGLQEVVASILQDAVERGVYNENLPVTGGDSLFEEFTIGGAVGTFADLALNGAMGRRREMASSAQTESQANAREALERAREAQAQRVSDAQQAQQEAIEAGMPPPPPPDLEDVDVSQIDAPTPNQIEDAEGRRLLVPGRYLSVIGPDGELFEAEERISFRTDRKNPDRKIEERYVQKINNDGTKSKVVLSRNGQPVEGFSIEGVAPAPESVPSKRKKDPLLQYARHVRRLVGNDLLKAGSFTYREGPIVNGNPTFETVDKFGQRYGKPFSTQEEAIVFAGNMNDQLIEANVSNSIEESIEASNLDLSQENQNTMFLYGYRLLHPDQNLITSAELDQAGETTVATGFEEQAIPDGDLGNYAPSKLTMSQRINKKRLAKGLPSTNTFTIEEAKSVLGKKFGNLRTGEIETETYQARTKKGKDGKTLKDKDGKPTIVVVSSAGEVITGRATGLKKKGSKDQYEVKPFKSMFDAVDFAKTRNADRNLTSINESVFANKKIRIPELERLLENKNIVTKLGSPEFRIMLEAFTGVKASGRKRINDLTDAEMKVLYQKIRSMPQFSEPTRLVNFNLNTKNKINFKIKQQKEGEAEQKEVVAPPVAPEGEPQEPLRLAPPLKTPESKTLNSIQKRLDKEMKGVGLADIKANISHSLKNVMRDANGNLVFGIRARRDGEQGVIEFGKPGSGIVVEESPDADAFYSNAANEIFLGLDKLNKNFSPEKQLDQALGLLSHEQVHAMRAMNLFTDKEWQVLSDAAKNRKSKAEPDKTFIQIAKRDYSRDGEEAQIEEAVAELVRVSRTDPSIVSGKPKNLIQRISNFFSKMIGFIDGSGFVSFEELIRDIDTGVVGARERGGRIPVEAARIAGEEAEKTRTPDFLPEMVEEGSEEVVPLSDKFSRTSPTESLGIDSLLSGREEVLPLDRKNTTAELAEALQRRAENSGYNLEAQTEENSEVIARIIADEVKKAYSADGNAANWYREKIDNLLAIASELYPELKDSDHQKSAFVASVAFYSNGLDVAKNLELAVEAYEYFRTNGRLPEGLGIGPQGDGIESAVKTYNAMLDEYGLEDTYKILNTETNLTTLKQLGYKVPAGDAASFETPISYIFGPKIGGGFYQNLLGNFSPITMDRWFMRTWGRITGTIKKDNPKKDEELREKFKSHLKTAKGRKKAELLGIDANLALESNEYLDSSARIFHRNYSKLDKKTGKTYSDRSELNKTAKNLDIHLTEGKIAPANGAERTFIRSTMDKTLDILSEEGIQLDTAAVQALIWYPEKELYIMYGAANAKSTPTDYEQEIRKIANEKGVSEQRITRAVDGLQRGRNIGSRRNEERGDRELSEESGATAFTGKTKARFIRSKIFNTIRSDSKPSGASRGNDGAIPQFFRRKAGTTSKKLIAGVPVRATERALNKGIKNRLTSSGIYDGKVLELESGKQSAKAFHKAITEAKSENEFGAAVYVYPESEYRDMKLFVTPDGSAGLALKGDDIVSLFSKQEHPHVSLPLASLAIQEGGRRLDAFDTALPVLYNRLGFKVVSRLKWDEGEAPPDWEKSVFDDFNNGEPDVVFMAWDADNFTPYSINEGVLAEDYGEALSLQNEAVEELNPQEGDFVERERADGSIVGGDPDIQKVTRDAGAVQKVVDQNEKDAVETTATFVPEFNYRADPEAQYVAKNPEEGIDPSPALLDKYSRSRSPEVDPKVKKIIDRIAPQAPENKTPGETYLETTDMGDFEYWVTKARAAAINKWARLEQLSRIPQFKENLADTSAMAAAIFSDRSMGIVGSVLKSGSVVYRNGVVQVEDFFHTNKRGERKQYRGLVDIMAPLFQNKYNISLEDLAKTYAIARRAEGMRRRGLPTPAKAGDLAVIEAEIAKYVNENGDPIIEEWYDSWQAFNNKTVEFMKATGLVDDALAEKWLEMSDYIPFYRQGEAPEGEILNLGKDVPSMFKSGMTTAFSFKKLKGSEKGVNVPMLDAITRNLSMAIDAGMKNVAQQRIIRDMVTIGQASKATVAQTKNKKQNFVVSFKVKGKDQNYVVNDPLLFESLQPVESGGLATSIVAPFSNILREMITRDPGFMLANMMRDTLSAYNTSGADFIPVIDTIKNLGQGIEELERFGVVGGYDFGNDPDDMVKAFGEYSKERGIDIEGGNTGLNMFKKLWNAAGRATTASDAATRRAVYKDVLARTGNEAEAAYQALEVINFSRRGRSPLVRFLTAGIPFLNARLQGIDVLYRGYMGYNPANRDKTRSQAVTTALARGGLITATTLAYWLLVSDDDQYKETPDEIKDLNWLVPTPMGVPLRLPVPFEVGFFFKTIPERILDFYPVAEVFGKPGATSSRELTDSVFRGISSTFEVNPFGLQIIAPVAEAAFNYNFFTQREIVPLYASKKPMQGLVARESNLELSKWLGEATNTSPMKWDHVLYGYTGTLGAYLLDTVDQLVLKNPVFTGEKGTASPKKSITELPVMKRFFVNEFSSDNRADFYRLHNAVTGISQAIKDLEATERFDEAEALINSQGHLLDLEKEVNYISDRLSKLRKDRTIIERSDYSPEVKRDVLLDINSEMDLLTRDVPFLKKYAKLPASNRFQLLGL